jgi:hypothetical protein
LNGDVIRTVVGHPTTYALFDSAGGHIWTCEPRAGVEVVSVQSVRRTFERRFTLLASQPGDFPIDFTLKRPWEVRPVQTLHMTVRASRG